MNTEIILNLLSRKNEYVNHEYDRKYFDGEVSVRDTDFEIIVKGEYEDEFYISNPIDPNEESFTDTYARLTSLEYLSLFYKDECYSTELEDGINDIVISDEDKLKILEFFNHITLI